MDAAVHKKGRVTKLARHATQRVNRCVQRRQGDTPGVVLEAPRWVKAEKWRMTARGAERQSAGEERVVVVVVVRATSRRLLGSTRQLAGDRQKTRQVDNTGRHDSDGAGWSTQPTAARWRRRRGVRLGGRRRRWRWRSARGKRERPVAHWHLAAKVTRATTHDATMAVGWGEGGWPAGDAVRHSGHRRGPGAARVRRAGTARRRLGTGVTRPRRPTVARAAPTRARQGRLGGGG